MNLEMQKIHYETITDGDARMVYEKISAACETREGGMTDADQMLVAAIARGEQIKKMLIADIEKRGVGCDRHNGRQTYYQENKSIVQLRAQEEQQRRHLAELKLTPNSRKGETVRYDGGDDFDNF